VPDAANARGMREVGFLPNAAAGYADAPADGRSTPGIAAALADGELSALYLLHADPLRTHPDRALWQRALEKANAVIAHSSFLTEGVREHATVVFPAASYAEKEGTVVHPDGRIQRVRPGIGRPGDTRMEWQVIADLAARLGTDLGVLTSPMATAQVFDAVPFYAGLTLDGLGGQGVRWPAREEASALPGGDEPGPGAPTHAASAPSPNGKLVLGTYRSIWAAPEVEASPALQFLVASQRAELSPQDAQRLGVSAGDRVAIASNGTRVEGTVAVRGAVPAGFVFLEEAIAQDGANALTSDGGPVLVEVTPS
jgi:NADH-quinone oxidoreductase subunit G